MTDADRDLLDAALARDGARPFLTWYDDATGERLELSVTTLAVWVAKTSWLLADAYALGAGDMVRLDLPRHWLRAVWAVASWRLGCAVSLDPRDGAAVLARGPADPVAPVPDEVVAVSLRPLGAPFAPGTLPAGAVDYAVEVPAYPDRLPPAVPLDRALVERAHALAEAWRLAEGGRLLVAEPLDPLDDLLAATLVPLVVDGSVVLCSPSGPAPDSRAAAERVTTSAGPSAAPGR
jgi:uncharacterized protein (TIGR03089 family)